MPMCVRGYPPPVQTLVVSTKATDREATGYVWTLLIPPVQTLVVSTKAECYRLRMD